jgi:arginyl-tRNA synthetase
LNDLKKLISEHLSELFEQDKHFIENLITVPPNIDMGDLAIPCFAFAKILKKSPQIIAEEGKKHLLEKSLPLKEIKTISGYMNFYIDRNVEISNVINEIVLKVGKYGSSNIGEDKVVTIDYSSPNVAKPIALHHLRSTMIGNSVANILEFVKYDVKRINYLGDWGTTFGKLLTVYEKWGEEARIEADGVGYLVELYTRFSVEAEKDPSLEDKAREWFKRMEDGDEQALSIWKKFRDISLKEFSRIYDRLGVKFDSFDGESAVNPFIKDAIDEIEKRLTLKKSQGADIIELEDANLPPVLIRKSDGATLYATRDIAEAMKRRKQDGFSKNLYVVATQQNLHFDSVFKVLSMLGFKWSEDCVHVAFGMMLMNDKKMATRTGNMVTLEDVLDQARDLALKIINEKNPELENKEEVAEQVGVGAIVFNDLKNKRIKNVNFDWEEVLNFDGETGPYVQYTFARITSIIDKAGVTLGDNKDFLPDRVDNMIPEKLSSPEEVTLVKELAIFPEKVSEAAKSYESSIIAKYLLDLVSSFNTFYNKHKVIVEDQELKEMRLLLVYSVRQVIMNAAKLLSLPLPRRM